MNVNITISTMEAFKKEKVYTMEEICEIFARLEIQILHLLVGKNSTVKLNEKKLTKRLKDELLLDMYKQHITKEAMKAIPAVITTNNNNNE